MNITTYQANAKVFQSIEVDSLLEISKKKSNKSNQLNDNKDRSFKTLKKSISFVLLQWQLDEINDSVQIPVI